MWNAFEKVSAQLGPKMSGIVILFYVTAFFLLQVVSATRTLIPDVLGLCLVFGSVMLFSFSTMMGIAVLATKKKVRPKAPKES